MDMLLVVEAMSAHFREHHEAIMRWSWKLFCAKWIRLIEAADKERKKREHELIEAEYERLRLAHEAGVGGGVAE